jgi:hypothetical protein
MAKGDWMLARKELSQLLDDDPAMLPAHLLLAEIAFRLQHPSELLLHIDPVLAAQPSNKRARLLLAIARKGLGNSAEARNELNDLIKDRPDDTEAQLELGLFDLADKEYGPAEAISRYANLAELRSKRLKGWWADEAKRLVQEQMMRSPQPSSLRLMVRTAVQAGQDDFALGQSQQALKETSRNYEAYIHSSADRAVAA